MSDHLRLLLREEAERIEVPRPPIDAILTDGSRRIGVRRTQGVIALAASVALIAGGLVGLNRFVADEARDPSPDLATQAPTPSATPAPSGTPAPTPSATAAPGSLGVSGTGVGGQSFGAAADRAVAGVTAKLGRPDLVLGPQRYFRIPGNDGWFEDPGDPLSLNWEYPYMSVSCWNALCLIFGGDKSDSLRLQGWELQKWSPWSQEYVTSDLKSPDSHLADTSIRLGDSWKKLHAAYPNTVVGGGEGASLVVQNTPWPGVFDGVGEWRLSGQWDFTRPEYAPPGAKVTRLSAGQGPEPGCC